MITKSYQYSTRPQPRQLLTSILFCFQPVFVPGNFRCSYNPELNSFSITCQKWGDIGKVVYQITQSDITEILFQSPAPISPNDVPPYEKLIREECLPTRWMLVDILNENEKVMLALSKALYEKRIQRQQEFITWLFNRLQIFGYHDLHPDTQSDDLNKIDEHFDFLIKGTPAQFCVMLRQFTQNLHAQTDYQQLVTQVLLPGSRKDVSNIPSDTNPVEVKLTLRRNQLSIHAHFLPVEGTLLRIHLNGDKNLWLLWDKVRDELEKLGWFTLPEIQDPAIPVETKLGPQQIETSTPIDFWMMIPNIGANRDIVRLWHQSLTCGQIATRVGLTKKTILNRINSLRKEYGIQIVPYRKSNFIKKPKDIHD